jgi:hypothetical protein
MGRLLSGRDQQPDQHICDEACGNDRPKVVVAEPDGSIAVAANRKCPAGLAT